MLNKLIPVLLLLFVSACGLTDPLIRNQAGRVAEQALEPGGEAGRELAQRNRQVRNELDVPVMAPPPRDGAGIIGEIDIGKTLNAERGNASVGKGKRTRVKLDFADTSLKDIVVVFMHDYLKKPYSFQDSFKDRKVNLFFDANATREEVIQLFDTLLDSYGVRLRYSGGTYLIGVADDKAPQAYQPAPHGVGDAVGVFRPTFVEAKDLLQLAKQVIKQGDRLSLLPGNILVLNSTSTELRAVAALVRDVDVPAFANKQILIYVPRYLSAASLLAVLDSYQSQLTGSQGGAKQFEAKQVPDSERVVIVAANAVARDLVVQFLDQTDVAAANQRRVFQYALGTQLAADVLPNLTSLLKSVLKNQAELSIVADKASNSLFIYASPEEFAEIRKLLARLDFRPPAIQVEVVIANVSLSSNMKLGVEWYLKSTGRWLSDVTTKLGVNTSFTSGLNLGIVGNNSTYAILQAIGSETTFSLLSSPKIVVKNGATAKISVGAEQPVIKQKTVNNASAGNNTVVEPEYKKIGLDLEVTPFVTQNNEVRMILKLKDTSITGTTLLGADSYPILANREINTELVTGDNKTVFLGGIRKQQTSDTSEKIPGLSDVSYLGALFRTKNNVDEGTELIVFATPTIMLDQQGADLVTAAIISASKREFVDPRPAPPAAATPVPATVGAEAEKVTQ